MRPLFEIEQPRKLEISSFIAEELMYDFVSHRLDEDHERVMNEMLKADVSLKRQEINLKAALEYCNQLSSLRVKPEVVQFVVKTSDPMDRLRYAVSWDKWPPSVKWVLEGLAVAVFVTLVGALVPWDKLITWRSSRDITLVEIENPNLLKKSPGKVPAKPAETAAPAAVETPVKVAEQKPPEQKPAPAEMPKAKTPTPTPATSVKVETPIKPTIEHELADADGKAAVHGESFVYVGNIAVKTFADVEKAKAEIESRGGQKAGKVDLGWEKPNGRRYFHFTLPESSYDDLTRIFKELGQVRISKLPHNRPVPAGQIRIILEMEVLKAKEQTKAPPKVEKSEQPASAEKNIEKVDKTAAEPEASSEPANSPTVPSEDNENSSKNPPQEVSP